MVYIDVEEHVESETEKNIVFLRTIRDAVSVTLADVHTMYDHQFAAIDPSKASGHEALERSLAPHPGFLRMMVVDDGQSDIRPPFLCPLPVELPETISMVHSLGMLDTDWLSHLKETIAVEWKVVARQEVFKDWFAKHERACIYAGIHAIDLNNHPGRTGKY